jgi:hypothetical protein
VKSAADMAVASSRGQAEIIRDDSIIFKDVPILSPNGDVMIPKMSFEIT